MSAVEVVTSLARFVSEDKADEAAQLLRPEGLEKFELMAREVQSIADAVTAHPLASDADEGRAAELLNRGVIAAKELDSLRRKHVDPLNAEVKDINGLFRILTDRVEALCGKGGTLERVILAYRREKAAKIQREQDEARRRQEAAARAEAEALAKAETAKTDKARQKALAEAETASRAITAAEVAAPQAMTRGVRTDSGTVTERRRLVVAGFSDMDQVPPSYWRDPLVVEALRKVLQKALDAGLKQIPGVVTELEESLTRRPGR